MTNAIITTEEATELRTLARAGYIEANMKPNGHIYVRPSIRALVATGHILITPVFGSKILLTVSPKGAEAEAAYTAQAMSEIAALFA